MQFKLAELRKKNNLTQQELGDILSVSYQTISKWENGVVSPDISMLPRISSYFGVSVDALLGLVPLETDYEPSNSGTADYWKNRLEYLQRTRKTLWNTDYMKFLVQEVWKIERPVSVLDCGCGYGAMGLELMPLLPEGSTYTGIDFAENMVQAAREIHGTAGYSSEFFVTDILNYDPNKKFDMVISQAVLRHVDKGELFLNKMIAFAKPGGLVVSIECNREFEATGLYIQGMNYWELCGHEGLRQLWKTELEKQNRDYSIAMKIPHYMKKAGLREIDSRMNDKVTVLEPEQPGYREILESLINADHWSREKTEKETEENISYFMNHGMSRSEAEKYCNTEREIVQYLREHREDVSLTKISGMIISYGRKG